MGVFKFILFWVFNVLTRMRFLWLAGAGGAHGRVRTATVFSFLSFLFFLFWNILLYICSGFEMIRFKCRRR
eukprot:COSAG06_NODE_1256_length_10087_cov_7.646676_10_plen_71_part_00